jgi:hypothetical protein
MAREQLGNDGIAVGRVMAAGPEESWYRHLTAPAHEICRRVDEAEPRAHPLEKIRERQLTS